MDLEQLKKSLRSSEVGFLSKYSDRVAVLERWRPGFALGAVAGALVAALGRLSTGAWGLGFTVAGAVIGAACGALVALMDYRKLELGQEAKNALRVADEAIEAADAAQRKQAEIEARLARSSDEAVAFDAKRLSRIEALRLMIETVEAALLQDATPEASAQTMLDIAGARIRDAMDYRAGDFHTITIFKCQRDPDQMTPIARNWTDLGAAQGGRSWPKGQGYTGALWSLAANNPRAQIVEPDTLLPGAQQRYHVADADPGREERYRSVASFPIIVGAENAVWGAVTATSSRAGVFDHQGDLARQSVEITRDIAVVAGLLAKLNRPTPVPNAAQEIVSSARIRGRWMRVR